MRDVIEGEATRVYEVSKVRPFKRVWYILSSAIKYTVGIFIEDKASRLKKYQSELYEEKVARLKYEARRKFYF